EESVVINSDLPQEGSFSASACAGETYVFHGESFTVSGTYMVTLPLGASNGCDSIIELTLVFGEYERSTINERICDGQVFWYNGQAYSEEGTYVLDTIEAMTGCDTILELNLGVDPLEVQVIDTAICAGESVTFFGVDYSLPGEYLLDTITASIGCDTVLRLRLAVHDLPTAEAGADQIIYCDALSVVLQGSASGGTPLWSGPGIHAGNANQLTPEVTQPGVYTLTVTSPE